MNFINSIEQHQVLSKSLVETTAQSLINEAEEGNVDVLSMLARLEFMVQVIEKAKEDLRKRATDELDLYGAEAKAGVKRFGVTFKHKEVGTRYFFDETKQWTEIKAQEDLIAGKRKALEDQLKALKSKVTILDETTGELNQLYPALKTSKTSVEISLPK
jgi:hypothetical protein